MQTVRHADTLPNKDTHTHKHHKIWLIFTIQAPFKTHAKQCLLPYSQIIMDFVSINSGKQLNQSYKPSQMSDIKL